MAHSPCLHQTLFLVWRLHDREESVMRAQARLAEGERRGLFRLRSLSAAVGEARAYLEPRGELEAILESVYDDAADLVSSRWIESG
jgi:hypothetical protein